MASQALHNLDESFPGNHSAVEETNHGRFPHSDVDRADAEYREVNVDQLSESDFEGMRDSGLEYSDHDYIGSNPGTKCPPEPCTFPTMGGVTDEYLNGETNDPCSVERTENRPLGVTSSAPVPTSAMRKMQPGVTNFRPATKDLALVGAQQPTIPGKSVSWKQNIAQPKKSGRPSKNEAREMTGDRLMGRAMVKAGMQTQSQPHQHIPSNLHHSQGVHALQDMGHMHGAAPIVTPARGPKIMPRGRSTPGVRRDISDEGNGGMAMMPIQQASTSFRTSSVSSPKRGPHFRSAQAAEEAHTREMMEAAQNALAPSNATISGHNIMINAQSQHSIVLPVQSVHYQQQPSQYGDEGDLPRTPGKVYTYSPTTSPNPRRTISESQEMNIHLQQEPLRMNPDGLPVTPGGNRKAPSRSGTPRSRMSISESTTSPRHYVVSPTRQGIMQSARPYSSSQRAMLTTLKSPPTTPILSLSQGPSTMVSAQMQMSSNAPMPSLHNQSYQQAPITRILGTPPMGIPYFDASGAQAAPLITAGGSNTYNPRKNKNKESEEAVEAEVYRNVKTIMQTGKPHRVSTTSTLSPRNETSDEDTGTRGRHVEPPRENRRSGSKRTTQKHSKRVVRQSSKDDSEENEHEESTWLVECICGQTEDDGEEMVACDTCIRWEHVDCIFPRTKKAPTGDYSCHHCAPRPTELTPTMAREYQERVKREKEMNSDLEVKRKLQERVAKRKEESSRKPHQVGRSMIQPKGTPKNDKSANINYRDLEKNEYSANAKRFLAVSRSSVTASTTPEIIKILRDHPRAKPLVVESNTFGLITTRSITGGDYIAEICGLVSLQKECMNRDAPPGSCNVQSFLFEKDGDKLIIDARKCGNYARYVRRSCKPNAELQEIMSGTELHMMIKANCGIEDMNEVKIGLESDWTKNPRSAITCTCRGEELKRCDVELFFNRKGKEGKSMVSISRRSLPINGTTPKGARSPIRRSVTEKKKGGSSTKIIAQKGKKKSTLKLPPPIRKAKRGSASTADESEREEGSEEYEESTADEKEEKRGSIQRRGRRNTGSTSEGKEKEIKKEEEMSISTPRSSARIRNDSEVKKEVESQKMEESEVKMKTTDKRDSVAGGSNKGGRKREIEIEEKKEIKEEIKEEPVTPVKKKDKKPWPKMDYSLPSERNKPSREERKLQAECERIEKDSKKKRGSSTRGRPAGITPVGINKEDKALTSGRGKRKAEEDTEDESVHTRSSIPVATTSTTTPLFPSSMRKRGNVTVKVEDDNTSSPAPSSLSSIHSPPREDAPAASPIPAGGKKKWLQRHQEAERRKKEEDKLQTETTSESIVKTVPSTTSISITSRTSTPTRSKRFNQKEERGAVEVLMNMGVVEKKGLSIREQMRKNAIKTKSLKPTGFSIGDYILKDYKMAAPCTSLIVTAIGPSTPPLPITPTPTTPIESAKSVKKTLSIEEYKKRRQTGGILTEEEKKEESERKIPPKKSFMPSADASASMSSLPNVKLPELEEAVGMDELSRRVYGDLSTRNKEGASTSTTPIMGKTQPTPKRQSINDRLKNEFSLPILSTPSPLVIPSSTIPTPTIVTTTTTTTISPIPIGSQLTPTSNRASKNRLSDARALNMEPPGMISTPLLSSMVTSSTSSPHIHPSPSPSLSKNASFLQRAASIRSNQK